MADARTNHFPFKPVDEIQQHYKDLKFGDFKHAITGAMLWKGQHADVETFYNSTHQKEGVECSACHMPKVKDPKTGKTFTSHWQTSPRHYIKETCLTCHKTWTEQQALYTIDSLKNKWTGKMRKAEFWLTRLIDKYEAAQNLGVDPAVLNEVRAEALRGAHPLRVVVGHQRRALPQPAAVRGLDQQGHGGSRRPASSCSTTRWPRSAPRQARPRPARPAPRPRRWCRWRRPPSRSRPTRCR